MTQLLTVVLGLLVLGILVFIHELGHFLAAKLCGIRVLAFSLGFGNPIFKKTVNGTEYRISSIPFGGYVKMAGENPEETRSGASDEFHGKPIWQRMIVALAGPLFNYVSAFIMLWVMFMVGNERPLYLERPVVGAVADSSIAMAAGVQAGDSVVSINNKTVTDWDMVNNAFALQEREYTLKYVRDGRVQEAFMKMKPSDNGLPKDPTGGLYPSLPAMVGKILPGSAAAEAGLQKGDLVRSIGGREITTWFELVSTVSACRTDTTIAFVIIREGAELTVQLKPRYDAKEKRPLIGINPNQEKGSRVIRFSAGAAVDKALKKGWDYTTMIFEVLGKLFARKISPNQFSGPLGIIPASGFMALQGFYEILDFMALIGINLAVLNLLPLIITDGGLIFFMLIELIRRRPLSIRTQVLFNKVAIALFLALFLYVSFNDVKRLPELFRIFGK